MMHWETLLLRRQKHVKIFEQKTYSIFLSQAAMIKEQFHKSFLWRVFWFYTYAVSNHHQLILSVRNVTYNQDFDSRRPLGFFCEKSNYLRQRKWNIFFLKNQKSANEIFRGGVFILHHISLGFPLEMFEWFHSKLTKFLEKSKKCSFLSISAQLCSRYFGSPFHSRGFHSVTGEGYFPDNFTSICRIDLQKIWGRKKLICNSQLQNFWSFSASFCKSLSEDFQIQKSSNLQSFRKRVIRRQFWS